jgi:hypothetical protein
MASDLPSIIRQFGIEATAKLSNPTVAGEPEDQLRAPLEALIRGMARLCGFPEGAVAAIGETSLADLKTRPDYGVTLRNALVGFIEVKAPGKGADPRRWRAGHDKAQWEKLQSLPNLIYTDGNSFSLWRSGEVQGEVVQLKGDVETAGADLQAPPALQLLFEDFFRWQPIPPRSAKQLAETSARLCRLLRDEVAEQLTLGSPALTALRTDWRKMLFPEATNAQFADGYAQAVTFGLLMARAKDIDLSDGLDRVSRELGKSNSLIATALRLLTDDAENQETLKTSLGTLVRVLDAVHWPTISRDDPDAWLYFYEDFLAVYDNALRKQTGSYYTPPEVVASMVRLVDEALRSPARFNLSSGFASSEVTVVDPAVGTGTFPLGILRQIAETVAMDEGEGAVPAAIDAAIQRLIAFEVQIGPFAVAQLRILAELRDLMKTAPRESPKMYVTDTLGDPYVEEAWLPSFAKPLAESRRQANRIKTEEPITVVIGNPPYKEKAKGRGGWVESGGGNSPEEAPLRAWMPPRHWGVSAHAKHLRNLYVYFWRWATWKVFDRHPNHRDGIVCFITMSGFLNGPGFQKMRDYLRRTAEEIWVIDCSPEGHRPEVNTRIFEGVQQPICIMLASRSREVDPATPATVRFRSLPPGLREQKFSALKEISLDTSGWVECPAEWRAPFLPSATGEWAAFPALESFFQYNGSGVMPGRTWIIAPDQASLSERWSILRSASGERQELLFHPHLVGGKPGDRHVHRVVKKGLPGYGARLLSIAEDPTPVPGVRYGFRSFDRQWIIPDNRLINRPNPQLWESFSQQQVYLTAPMDQSPTNGPAVSFSANVPDLHHYSGRGGRAFPLWRDSSAQHPNPRMRIVEVLVQRYQIAVEPQDLVAYIAAVLANPAFTARFQADLVKPGLRVPLTSDPTLFTEAVALGREVIWLHTFGERFADPSAGRPAVPPRLPPESAPRIPREGAIPTDPAHMPDSIDYDATTHRLRVGKGYIENVDPRVWSYEVSGKQILRQWFSYRKANRERPIIGDRRPPSALGDIQPDHWLAEYTTELLNVIHVLGRLIQLEPRQAELLERICKGSLISEHELRDAGAFGQEEEKLPRSRAAAADQTTMLEMF